jgi:glutamine synthetase
MSHTIFAEYIWIDGYGKLRSKNRVIRNINGIDFKVDDATYYPQWNYDGSSTNQATTNESEVILKPVAVYEDPFFQLTLPLTGNI